MKKNTPQTSIFGAAMILFAVLFALFAGNISAQNPWPDYDFKAVNADGDTLYYRITSSTAPYTVAIACCHDSATYDSQLPLDDYDNLIVVPDTVTFGGITYGITSIDEKAFYLQKGIRNIHLPAGITSVGSLAFAYSNIVSVDIPGNVPVLRTGIFVGCDSLANLTLNEGLLEIEENIFSSNRIQTLTFPASLREFRPLTEGTLSCKRIVFQTDSVHPNDTLHLAPSCFRGLSQHLQQIVFSDNIFQLPNSCFASFRDLNKGTVVLPARLKEIPYRCFYDCRLYDVQFPEILETISEQAFMSASVDHPLFTIPASTNYIGSHAFLFGGFLVVTLECEQPPTLGDNPFQSTRHIEFTVPCGSLPEYLSAPGWAGIVTSPSVSIGEGDGCVGVDNYELADFKVYPNPANDVVMVECTADNEQYLVKTVEMYDIYGKLVNTVNVTDNPIRVNVSALPAGVYVLRVKDTKGNEYHQKIVKK